MSMTALRAKELPAINTKCYCLCVGFPAQWVTTNHCWAAHSNHFNDLPTFDVPTQRSIAYWNTSGPHCFTGPHTTRWIFKCTCCIVVALGAVQAAILLLDGQQALPAHRVHAAEEVGVTQLLLALHTQGVRGNKEHLLFFLSCCFLLRI